MSLDFSLYDGDEEDDEVFDINITHNLCEMAREAGIHKALWRPAEIDAKIGADIIELLESGLHKLKSNQEYYEKFNAENGWGTYEHFVPFVEKCLGACVEYPNARINVSI